MTQPPHGRRPYPFTPPSDESPTVRLPAPPGRHPTARYPIGDAYGYPDDDRGHQYADDDRAYRHTEDDRGYRYAEGNRYPDDDRGYGSRHRYADDDGRYDPPYADEPVDRRRRPSPRRSRSRGQLFALLVLVLAAGVSVWLGTLVYDAVSGLDLTSADPLGTFDDPLATFGTALLCALVVFVLAIIALFVARPKFLAILGLLAAVLLPVAGVVVGGWYGVDVLRQRVETSVSAAGSTVDELVRELERRGIDIGPIRDLLPG